MEIYISSNDYFWTRYVDAYFGDSIGLLPKGIFRAKDWDELVYVKSSVQLVNSINREINSLNIGILTSLPNVTQYDDTKKQNVSGFDALSYIEALNETSPVVVYFAKAIAGQIALKAITEICLSFSRMYNSNPKGLPKKIMFMYKKEDEHVEGIYNANDDIDEFVDCFKKYSET